MKKVVLDNQECLVLEALTPDWTVRIELPLWALKIAVGILLAGLSIGVGSGVGISSDTLASAFASLS